VFDVILYQPAAGEAFVGVLLEAEAVGGVPLQSAAGIVEVVLFLLVCAVIERYIDL